MAAWEQLDTTTCSGLWAYGVSAENNDLEAPDASYLEVTQLGSSSCTGLRPERSHSLQPGRCLSLEAP